MKTYLRELETKTCYVTDENDSVPAGTGKRVNRSIN